jgi:pyruvate dehydrogenase E2 component (dihydrolipoamide acetyltransferase)
MNENNTINVVAVPQIGPNDTEVTLVEWHVSDGDLVAPGDIIVSLETAKAVTEIESELSGYIIKLRQIDEILNIGEELALVGNNQKGLIKQKKDYLIKKDSEIDKSIIATKKAHKLANQLNINIDSISVEGIIKTNDVQNYFDSIQKPVLESSGDYELVELNDYQKEIIRSVSWQKENAIVGYIEKILNIESALTHAKSLKKDKKWLFDPYFAIIAYNFVQCISEHIFLNSTIVEGKLKKSSIINLGITVDVEDKLLISVLPNANKLNKIEFIENIFSLQKRTVSGKLKSYEMKNPTIGISSLSSHGVSKHIPVLLPRTSLIMALSDVLPNTHSDDSLSVFGITYDHRLHTGVQISVLLKELNNTILNIT